MTKVKTKPADKVKVTENTEKQPESEKTEVVKETKSTQTEREANTYDPFTENVEDKGYNKASPLITGMKDGEFDIPEFIPERKVVDVSGKSATENETEVPDTGGKSNKTESKQHSSSSASSGSYKEPSGFTPQSSGNFGNEPINTKPQSTSNSFDKPTTKKDAKSNAERLADVALAGYAQLHTFAYMGFSMTPDKLQRRATKGKFDMDALNIPIPISATEEITVLEYLTEYDKDLRRILEIDPEDNRCYLSKEFVDNVRPALIELFVRKGIGMTPEQKILYYVGMDVISKGTQMVAMKVGMNQILKGVSEMQKKMNADNGVSRPLGIPNYKREKKETKKPAAEAQQQNQYIEKTTQKPENTLQSTFMEPGQPSEDHMNETLNENTKQPEATNMPEVSAGSQQGVMSDTLGSSNLDNQEPIDYSKIGPHVGTTQVVVKSRGRKPGSRDSRPRSSKPYMKSNKKSSETRKKLKEEQESKSITSLKPGKVLTPPVVTHESELETINEA